MVQTSPPEDIPVQLNIKIPWKLKEELALLSKWRRCSITQLVREALEQTYQKDLTDMRWDNDLDEMGQ